MKLSPRKAEEPELNLISLVDIFLLLLVFFMISTTFRDEASIKIRLPEASEKPALSQQQEVIEISVGADGNYRVNGQALINTSSATLASAIVKIAGERRELPITIRADARATHQSVVTAMDVVGRLGFSAISIATVNTQTTGAR